MPRRGIGGCLQGFAAGLGFACGNQLATRIVVRLVIAAIVIYTLVSGPSL